MLFIAGRGIAQVVTNGNLQPFRNPEFQVIGLGRVFGMPVQVIIMLVIVVFAWWLIRRTLLGRQILAVGGNEKAARLAGIPVNRVKTLRLLLHGHLRGHCGPRRHRHQLRIGRQSRRPGHGA